MKYDETQKKKLKQNSLLNFKPTKKDENQISLQEIIDSHYPVAEKYLIVESKINKNLR